MTMTNQTFPELAYRTRRLDTHRNTAIATAYQTALAESRPVAGLRYRDNNVLIDGREGLGWHDMTDLASCRYVARIIGVRPTPDMYVRAVAALPGISDVDRMLLLGWKISRSYCEYIAQVRTPAGWQHATATTITDPATGERQLRDDLPVVLDAVAFVDDSGDVLEWNALVWPDGQFERFSSSGGDESAYSVAAYVEATGGEYLSSYRVTARSAERIALAAQLNRTRAYIAALSGSLAPTE